MKASLRTRPRVASLRPLINITRDLATPSVAIGECAASANRGFTGQGPMASAVNMSLSGPPAASSPKACTRRSFAPTRSARTPPVVTSPDGRRETPTSPAIPPRAASPVLPRRNTRSAAPEVPSIDEPAAAELRRRSVAARWALPPVGRESAREGPTLTGDPRLSTACHQDVENTGAVTAIQRLLRSRTFRCP